CEEQLARERYADALIDDPRAKTYFDTPWVTGHDNELRVFPLNTSFGAQSLVDMADVAKELDLGAFAFDVAGGGARYYGPAVPRCPARAWDERGVFVEEAVAIASLIDWVHQQKTSEGRPVAAIINPGAYSSYMTTFRCDSSMLESSPDSIATGLAQCLRPRLGHKTMVLWETYEYEEWLRPDLSQAEYIDALRGIADWTVQACFQVVALPTPRIAMGLTPIVQWLPVLRDMVLAGWEPVPAAIRDDGSWVSRAGSSLGCFLATGNATRQDRPVQLYVDDAWIGDGNFLWAAVGPRKPAGPVEHAVWPNKPTAVHATIPPRQPLVLQSVATLRKLSGNIRAAVSRDGDSSRQTLTLRFDGRSTGELAFAVPPYFAVTSVTVDGKPVESVTSDGGRATMPLRVDGSSTVAVELRSLACRVSEADLQAFPQLVGDRMDFSVALDVNAGDHVMRSANWIANYFSTYFARAADPPARIKPARIITYPTEAQNENAKLIRLTLVDGRKLSAPWEITMPDQRTLVVAAQDDRALTDGVRHLLSVWDKKFVWAGPLPPLSMLKRVGLAGKQLPAD
ncbi:MAG: hypothetical protein H5T86_12340, partial [Armatimonadetes bacterium]|nr:hypothetical protein [Armatimonadota bacterium]